MIAHILLTSTILLTPGDFRRPDASLERYTLRETAESSMQDPRPGSVDRPLLWRLLGWGNYVTAGAVVGSQYYRQERTPNYVADPDNDAARITMFAGTAQGANDLTDRLYEGQRFWAWLARAGSVAALGWTAGSNFYSGWNRR